MSVGARLRFAVLKRDGFRCAYCGITAMAELLQVDHVIPQSKGGTDDIENLVTACARCNVGKSDVLLEELSPSMPTAQKLREHANQVKAYLDAQKELSAQRESVVAFLCGLWRERVLFEPTVDLANRFRSLVIEVPLSAIVDSINAVASAHGLHKGNQCIRYFYGCLRRRVGEA